jgi:hypothetical protein
MLQPGSRQRCQSRAIRMSGIDDLKRLAELRQGGVLSEAEFTASKERLFRILERQRDSSAASEESENAWTTPLPPPPRSSPRRDRQPEASDLDAQLVAQGPVAPNGPASWSKPTMAISALVAVVVLIGFVGPRIASIDELAHVDATLSRTNSLAGCISSDGQQLCTAALLIGPSGDAPISISDIEVHLVDSASKSYPLRGPGGFRDITAPIASRDDGFLLLSFTLPRAAQPDYLELRRGSTTLELDWPRSWRLLGQTAAPEARTSPGSSSPSSASPTPAPSPPQVDDREAWRAQILNCSVDSLGFVTVEGQVANDSGSVRSYGVRIAFDGSPSAEASVTGVMPGEVRNFTARPGSSSAAGAFGNCRIDQVNVLS